MHRNKLTIEEAANLLNCKRSQIYKYIRSGDIEVTETRVHKYVFKDELEHLVSKRRQQTIRNILITIVTIILIPGIGFLFQFYVSKPIVIIDEYIIDQANPLNNEFFVLNSGPTKAKDIDIKIYDPFVTIGSGTILKTVAGKTFYMRGPTHIKGIDLSPDQRASFSLKELWIFPNIIPREGIINFEINYKDFLSFITYKKYETYQFSFKDGNQDWDRVGNYGKKLSIGKIKKLFRENKKNLRIDRSADSGALDLSKHIDFLEVGNANGLAVDPDNGNIYITTNSYGDKNNLWKFSTKGEPLFSTRVNFDTGPLGSISKITFSRDGHLIVHAARNTNLQGNSYERSIITITRDGTRIISSFRTDHYLGGDHGIAFDPGNDHLLITTGMVNQKFQIHETHIDGKLYKIHTLDTLKAPIDIAFDPFTKSIIVLSRSGTFDQYKLDSNGFYKFYYSFELASVGDFDHNILAFDINRSNGLFYINEDNEWVVEIDRVILGMKPIKNIN